MNRHLNRRTPARRTAYQTGSNFSIGPTTARYLILLMLAVFSLFYLIQSAQGADKGIEIRQLEQQKTELDKELTTLEVNASRWQSLQNLNQAASSQGLVPIGNSVETLQVAE